MTGRLRTQVLSSFIGFCAILLGTGLVIIALLEVFATYVVDRVLASMVYVLGRVLGPR